MSNILHSRSQGPRGIYFVFRPLNRGQFLDNFYTLTIAIIIIIMRNSTANIIYNLTHVGINVSCMFLYKLMYNFSSRVDDDLSWWIPFLLVMSGWVQCSRTTYHMSQSRTGVEGKIRFALWKNRHKVVVKLASPKLFPNTHHLQIHMCIFFIRLGGRHLMLWNVCMFSHIVNLDFACRKKRW